jgi:hypothetical protein
MPGADPPTLAGTAASVDSYPAGAELNANLIEFNQHFLERASAELSEAWSVLIKLNTEPHVAERFKLYQEWLQAFSRRRVDDATYVEEVARALSGVNFRVSLGLDTKRDFPTSKAM